MEQPTALRLADALANLRRWHELTDDDCDGAAAELRRLHEVEKQYHELLYAVGNKYEGESRHQTALRYIQQAEIIAEHVRDRVATEREACAAACEEFYSIEWIAQDCAAAIRARSQTE